MVSSLPRKSELMRRPTSVSRSTASRYRKRGSGRASAGALMVVSLLGFVDQSDGGKSICLLHAREYIGVVPDLVREPQAERACNGHLEAEIVLHVGVVGVALDQKPVDDLGRFGELVLEAHVATQDDAVLRFAGLAYLGKAVTRAALDPELRAFGVDDLVPQTGRERRLERERTEPVVLVPLRAEPVGTLGERVVGLAAHLPSLRTRDGAVATVVSSQPEGVGPFLPRLLDLERGVSRLVVAVAARERSADLALARPVRKCVTRRAGKPDQKHADPFSSLHRENSCIPLIRVRFGGREYSQVALRRAAGLRRRQAACTLPERGAAPRICSPTEPQCPRHHRR